MRSRPTWPRWFVLWPNVRRGERSRCPGARGERPAMPVFQKVRSRVNSQPEGRAPRFVPTVIVRVLARVTRWISLRSSSRGNCERVSQLFVAVDGIDFEIAPGESFGFLGSNGAGKTSTMRMISAVSKPTSGDLRIFGLDPRTHGPVNPCSTRRCPARRHAGTRVDRERKSPDVRALLRPLEGHDS
jgi:hypothetical protein